MPLPPVILAHASELTGTSAQRASELWIPTLGVIQSITGETTVGIGLILAVLAVGAGWWEANRRESKKIADSNRETLLELKTLSAKMAHLESESVTRTFLCEIELRRVVLTGLPSPDPRDPTQTLYPKPAADQPYRRGG